MQTLQQLQQGHYRGATYLKLSEGLTRFPEAIFELADTLETLDLSFNQLHELPADFGRLWKLKTFFCSENKFTVLPDVLADCPLLDIVGFKANHIEIILPRALNQNLRWLILTHNRIAELPPEIGNCPRMQKLMLAGNQLKTLPAELSLCRNLALLRISANRLQALPAWLLSMPKLSWLAFSGNPFCEKPVIQPLPFINWPELQTGQLLGEGASGIISKATWHHNGEPKEVAVKLFKGDVTSDGLPEDEMNACISAGNHDGLVTLIGQITGHPENKKGLVMELIPERYFNLGLPPSLISCSRDVFKDGQMLTAQQALRIAGTIVSVAAHLHGKGIMHSDLYAHNTLIDHEGNTLFGDFGAACFYNKADSRTAAALERLEVSAYGYLLDDLITLCNEQAHPAITKLSELRDACLTPDIMLRPDFAALKEDVLKLEAD